MTNAAPTPEVTSGKVFSYENDVLKPIDILNGAEMGNDGKVIVYDGEQRIEVGEFEPGYGQVDLPRFAAIDIGTKSTMSFRLLLGPYTPKSGFVEVMTQQIVGKGIPNVTKAFFRTGVNQDTLLTMMRSDSPHVAQMGRYIGCDIVFSGDQTGVSRVHTSTRIVSNGQKSVLLLQTESINGAAIAPLEKPAATELPTDAPSLRV